jgi:hypothetical protein
MWTRSAAWNAGSYTAITHTVELNQIGGFMFCGIRRRLQM